MVRGRGVHDLDQMEDRAQWKGVGGYDMYVMPKGMLKGRGGAKLNKKPAGQGWAWVKLATLQAARFKRRRYKGSCGF